METGISEATEIRNLPAYYLAELARILNVSNQWKDLMGKVPKTLRKDTYVCKISQDNTAKFISEHYKLIEEASRNTGRLSSEILLDDWGCSGRVRPSVGHLLHLLKESELYRAADYVSDNILKRGNVTRPSQGPAARVKIFANTQEIIGTPKTSPAIPDDFLPDISELQDKSRSKLLPPLSNLLNQSISSGQDSSDLIPIPNDQSYLSTINPSNLPANYSYLPPNSIIQPGREPSTSDSFLPNISAIKENRVAALPESPTRVRHFPYHQLAAVTDNFDETPFTKIAARNEKGEPHYVVNGRFLGSGAFGSVHLALGLFDTPLAVKRMHLMASGGKEDDFASKQFKNEVELLCNYRHKNLLSLVGFSCDGLAYCLVYEYITGGNLKDRLQAKGELLWRRRLNIAKGIADAVTYLHTASLKPVIHRDIKTANILLDAFDEPKLCDFGTLRKSSATTTETTKIYGTSAYMAPEANRGDVSVKMDTYSFGVVLLELVTGLPVIDENREGRDLVTYVESFVKADIEPLLDTKAGSWSSKNVHFGHELFEISINCLKDKRDRPTMIDVTDNLLELIQKT